MEMEIDSKWTTTTVQSTAQYSSHCEWSLTEPARRSLSLPSECKALSNPTPSHSFIHGSESGFETGTDGTSRGSEWGMVFSAEK